MINFKITPASQIPTKAVKKAGPKPKTPSQPKQLTLQQKATKRGTTVQLAAYGNKLFEPTLSKERPIIVEFVDWWSDDSCRFSKDGFFGIKYIVGDKRCYLLYFINPVKVVKGLTVDEACKEAVEFKTYEFENDPDYPDAIKGEENTYEGLIRIRAKSALGKVEKQLISILKERLVAEKFLKRQRLIEKQDLDWETYKVEQELREKELEKADKEFLEQEAKLTNDEKLEVGQSNSGEDEGECIKSGETGTKIEVKEEVKVQPQETKKVNNPPFQKLKTGEGTRKVFKPIVWGKKSE